MVKLSGIIAVFLILCAQAGWAVNGYIDEIPQESSAQAEARHKRVAERRSGLIITVHRGASSFAPENTLEAYAAAMDYGADGCEIDLRRSADGVLFLFHDDMLDHLTNRFGEPSKLTYSELLSLKHRSMYGTATAETRIPTFAAVLVLARQRAMLLHFDMKEPGIEDDVIKMIDEADMWDHVVSVSEYNSGKILAHPKYKPLPYKAPGLFETHRDMDPATVKEDLARPGEMIIVDDPRIAVRELKRLAYKPVPLPGGIRQEWSVAKQADQLKSGAADELIHIIISSYSERTQPDGDDEYQALLKAHIIARAQAAQEFGELGQRSSIVIAALEDQVKHRSLYGGWEYHGLDGAMAAFTLSKLQSTASVPVLIDAFRNVNPDLINIADEKSRAWADWRIKWYTLIALGDIRCKASKDFLLGYLSLSDEEAAKMGSPKFMDAAEAVMHQELSQTEAESLLKNSRIEVRGEAVLGCLNNPTPERLAALKHIMPWAVDLPRARR